MQQQQVRSNRFWKELKRLALGFDTLFEWFAIAALSAMTLIVTMQVITRKLFNFVFFWSEELTILLLIWYGFMGIAIGFREHLHIAMSAFTRILPKWMQRALDYIIAFTTFLFGLYLVVFGWQFTALMHGNQMPAMEIPMSVQYMIIPITGFMTMIYGLLQTLNVDTVRHKDQEEVISE